MKRNTVIGILCVILASVCYGITPILSNAALNGGLPADFVANVFGENALKIMAADSARAMKNESVVGISMGIAGIISFFTCLLTKKSLRIPMRQIRSMCAMGGASLALTCMLISFAYNFIPAGMAIVLHFTYPVFVLVASMLFFKEKPTPIKCFSLLTAIAGIALLSFGGFDGQVQPVGILLAVISGMTYAAYFIAGKNASYASADTAVSNTFITLTACVICSLTGILMGRFTLPSDWFMWLILILEALLGYVIALQLMLKGMKLIGACAASALNTLEPAFASLTSMLVFGEIMGLIKGCGVIFVLLAALMSILALNNKKA